MPNHELAALVESAYKGVRVITCPTCKGEGEVREPVILPCRACHGSGITTERRGD